MELKANNPSFKATREGAGSCPHCRNIMPRLVDCAPQYFRDGFVSCGHSGHQVDLWKAVLEDAIRMSMAPGWALAALGAGSTNFVMPMETGKYYPVELSSHDVPADAKILTRNYTSQGGDVTAMEQHGNAPPLRFPGTMLRLVGVPLGEGPLPRMGQVSINVVWIRSGDSEAWSYLVTAFESAAAKEYAPSLVFAQSAVEISMMPLIESRFRLHVAEKKVKHFTNYSRALNVILPYLCGEAGLAQMPKVVHDALERLGDRRNKVIHQGAKAAAITPTDAMEGLCAASFGFEYMRYVGPSLLKEGK
jgi:hypothetical protein